MASYKDVLRMLRKGESPERIARLMDMRPSHWQRMLNGKRFQDALQTEEDLAVVIASHAVSLGMHGAAERLNELLDSEKPETVRKVALAFLHEGLRRAGGRKGGKLHPRFRADRLPWLDGGRDQQGSPSQGEGDCEDEWQLYQLGQIDAETQPGNRPQADAQGRPGRGEEVARAAYNG